MKRFRLLAFLLPVVFVIAASTAASASTNSPAAPAAPSATVTNFIINFNSGLNLGVIHVDDGVYTHGTYDALLPNNADTNSEFGWTTTAGWYTGPGYCTHQWRFNTTTDNYDRQLPDLGAGQHFIGANTFYEVQAYQC